jgi:hypothetical protein
VLGAVVLQGQAVTLLPRPSKNALLTAVALKSVLLPH